MAIYLNDWRDSGERGLLASFEIGEAELEGVEILLATYEYEWYSGDAFVLFRKDGRLYEVNGSHCSCFGLEGQWEPEETSAQALLYRIERGKLGQEDHTFAVELREVLGALETLDAQRAA